MTEDLSTSPHLTPLSSSCATQLQRRTGPSTTTSGECVSRLRTRGSCGGSLELAMSVSPRLPRTTRPPARPLCTLLMQARPSLGLLQFPSSHGHSSIFLPSLKFLVWTHCPLHTGPRTCGCWWPALSPPSAPPGVLAPTMWPTPSPQVSCCEREREQ